MYNEISETNLLSSLKSWIYLPPWIKSYELLEERVVLAYIPNAFPYITGISEYNDPMNEVFNRNISYNGTILAAY
jgi:hypothetical protein